MTVGFIGHDKDLSPSARINTPMVCFDLHFINLSLAATKGWTMTSTEHQSYHLEPQRRYFFGCIFFRMFVLVLLIVALVKRLKHVHICACIYMQIV